MSGPRPLFDLFDFVLLHIEQLVVAVELLVVGVVGVWLQEQCFDFLPLGVNDLRQQIKL